MKKSTERFLVISILAIAVFARLWHITTMPGGLFPDQAANGEDVLSIFHGDRQPFYERGNGREALFFYWQALFVWLFGIHVWPMFAASACVGIATVWVTYLAGKRLFGEYPALFAMLFLATNQWHVTISRTGFRASTVPLFVGLSLYFLAGLFEQTALRRVTIRAIGAGIAFGLGWYTYISYRIFPAVLLLSGSVLFLQDLVRRPRLQHLRRLGGLLCIFLLTSLLTATPLIRYFHTHPGAFLGRASNVSIFNPDLNHNDLPGTVVDVVTKSLLSFFIAGDKNPRQNVPGFPFLSPLPAMFLIVGFVLVCARVLQYLHRLFLGKPDSRLIPFGVLFLLLAFMMAPAVSTAEGIPHGLRTIGEIPAVFWTAGLGAAWLVHRIRRFPSPFVRVSSHVLLGFFCACTLLYDLSLYFVVSAHSPRFWYEYRTDLTGVVQYLTERANTQKPTAYLALDDFSVQTVHYLTTPANHPYVLVKPEHATTISLLPTDVFIFTQSTLPDADRYLRTHSDASILFRSVNMFQETTMVIIGKTRSAL